MENRINIAELLKYCPKGMELDCTAYDNVSFDKISNDKKDPYPIFCYITDEEGNRSSISFTENGCESKRYGAKCVIFPKGKTTWEGFHRPFKDGDIVVNASNEDSNAFVYAGEGDNYYECYVGLTTGTSPELSTDKSLAWVSKKSGIRFATEEEKEKLFQVIKDNGYKWDVKTKSLKKLIVEPKFKVGDRVKSTYNTNQYIIKGITTTHYTLEEVKHKFKYTEPIINDKDWELVPNKFEINTLKPFESRVLVRDDDCEIWRVSFWGCLLEKREEYRYDTTRGTYAQCVPYEGNEHLLCTSDECDEYYKNWE